MRTGILATLVLAAGLAAGPAAAVSLETPMLRGAVEAGTLPPLAERLPAEPHVLRLDGEGLTPGIHGGELRLLMARPRDVRMVGVYGYARLVGYTPSSKLVPDILARVENDGDRSFTLHLRPGHRWSDGHPFTSEDFRYYWQDVLLDPALSPAGPPAALLAGGKPPRVEIIDTTTVRYSWPQPNPHFLPALAAARPLAIFGPAHYLKRFHVRYAEEGALAAAVAEAGVKDWAALHRQKDRAYADDNPELPTLDPWVPRTAAPASRFVFERNPYFHRVDGQGRQLPYIDRVAVTLADTTLIALRTAAGASDLQARYLRFDNYTFLKESEDSGGYGVRLWRTGRGARVALYPNLNAADPVWRALLRDVRFRRALSLAIDRGRINKALFYGLAREGANTVLRESPLYDPAYQQAWAGYDPAAANALLDQLGLVRRDAHGIRLLPDGRPLDIVVDTAAESTEETDVLTLVSRGWKRAGVALSIRPSRRADFRARAYDGNAVMTVWTGLDNGLPTAAMSPHELAPTMQTQLQWPRWGLYFETGGKEGTAPDMPAAAELLALNAAWAEAADDAARTQIWRRMLAIQAEEVFSIGIVAGVRQPVVVNRALRNVPEEGVYAWSPGAYFGTYLPDTFWFDETRRGAE